MSSISIIVPVLNEEQRINSLINHIEKRFKGCEFEIIVVDADKNGSTIINIKNTSIKKITSKKGRAFQMNKGALISKNEILLFLHADSILPENPFIYIQKALKTKKAGAFDLGINTKNLLLKIIEKTASTRSKITKIPYGDQGIFIKKEIFNEINGYSEIPLMEDIDLMQKLKKNGYKIKILEKKILTSPRRWEKQGIIYCSARNIIISTLYYLGVKPERLIKFY